MKVRRRVGLLVLAASVTLSLVGASRPLNPLVTRTAQPAGAVPPGCEEGLAPAPAPRVDLAEVPDREIVPASIPAPPSRSLRTELESAQRALARNDRPAFDEHLRAARALLASYPPGGERSRAEEVIWALGDAAVLWDAQFASPFFDESSEAYTRASRYAGYAEAVRRSVLTDDSDRRFYPAAESRDFVTRVAAERLQRLGIRGTTAPPTRSVRAETPSPAPRRATASASSSTPRRTTSTARSSGTTPRRRTSSAPAIARSSKPAAPASSTPSSSPDPSEAATPTPAEPAPTAPPASASQASADAPASPVAESPVTGTEDATPLATDTATTTAAPATPEPAPATTPQQRSVLVPALLIAIGLGVLFVLFRASK